MGFKSALNYITTTQKWICISAKGREYGRWKRVHLKREIEMETLKHCAIWKISNGGIEIFTGWREKPAQRLTWSFIPHPPASSPSVWWMPSCFPSVIFLLCFMMSGYKVRTKARYPCSRCLSKSFKMLSWHPRHYLLINREYEVSHL